MACYFCANNARYSACSCHPGGGITGGVAACRVTAVPGWTAYLCAHHTALYPQYRPVPIR